mgnify:CR=1 FL=1
MQALRVGPYVGLAFIADYVTTNAGNFTSCIRYRYEAKDRWEAIGPSKRKAALADWRFNAKSGC